VPANTSPIFSVAGDIQWATSTNAIVQSGNTTTDLTTGTIYPIFTGGTNGSYVQRIRFRHLGTNVASVGRVWINNGSTTGTAANNTLWDEITLAANTISQVAAAINYELPLNFALPAGYIIYVTLGTAVAAGFKVTIIGGDY
jgi:hypothetical protein